MAELPAAAIVRIIAEWAESSARSLAPARPPEPGKPHQCVISADRIEAVLDGLEIATVELRALAARLDAEAAGGRPRLALVEGAGG